MATERANDELVLMHDAANLLRSLPRAVVPDQGRARIIEMIESFVSVNESSV